MIPSHQPVIDQGIEDSKPLYSIEEEEFSKFSSEPTVSNPGRKNSKSPQNIKEEDFTKFEQTSLLTQAIDNDLSLLTPLKAPKSYGTYSKQQQEDVIAFIKDGHSLRTAEKVFGIPKSTMHCWLKKLHIKSDLLNTMKVDNYSDLNIETSFPYSNDASYMDESDTKVKPWKDSRSHNPQRKTSPPSSPIVIEESELIRFLQSSEGLEMISKAYSVGVSDFLNFVNCSKSKTQESLKGLLVSSTSSRPVDVVGFRQPQKQSLDVKDGIRYYQQVSPNTARKRNLHNDYFNFDKTPYPGVAVLQKKIKVEQNIHDSIDGNIKNNNNNNNSVVNKNSDSTDSKNKSNSKTNRKKSNNKNNNDDNNNKNNINSNINNKNGNNTDSSSDSSSNGRDVTTNGSLLASLLTKNSQKPGMQNKLVLTTKQYLAANKIISSVQPDLVNTYVSSRPLLVSMVNTRQLSPDQRKKADNDRNNSNTTQSLERTSELSFGYPKVTNPVSIKAERLDSEIALPCDVSPNNGRMHYVRTLSPIVHSITKPVVTSNNTATLNLNEINRTQSEKELMAMVDGDNVSADELCAEFKETLELSKWVDNETWYMDQYLQHFQVSPALTSPDSSLPDADSDDADEEVSTGLTFAVDKTKDKEKKNKNVMFENVNKLVPVTVKIFEHCKNSGEVWTTLSSPGHLSTSPHSRDGLLTSPRIYDGLLCSPPFHGGSPRKERLITHLQETGLDPNLIQPNFSSRLMSNN